MKISEVQFAQTIVDLVSFRGKVTLIEYNRNRTYDVRGFENGDVIESTTVVLSDTLTTREIKFTELMQMLQDDTAFAAY